MGKEQVSTYLLQRKELASLFDHLKSIGYQNVGNIYRDGALMIEKVENFEELATGFHEEIGPGHCQVGQKNDHSLFQYTVGPSSFKKFLHPPKRKLWSADRKNGSFEVIPEEIEPPKLAFWGIRSCELKAIDVLDRVFMRGDFTNPWYRQAREDLITIAVSCTRPSPNCFCTTTHTGPHLKAGYDLGITEILGEAEPQYVAEAGSPAMTKIVERLKFKKADNKIKAKATDLVDQAAAKMKLRFQPQDAAQTLKNNLEHPRWDEIAKKCLSCANCTMVCPTCFCTTVEDITDITGDHTERWARWDSCFNGDFSYIHGGKIRNTAKSRYRQWLTHKFSSWYDQYGTFGCVGCGRCITWCPVGIDLTKEYATIKTGEV